jgi:hypothetical protein
MSDGLPPGFHTLKSGDRHAQSEPRRPVAGAATLPAIAMPALAQTDLIAITVSLGGSLSRGPRVLRRLKWINMTLAGGGGYV